MAIHNFSFHKFFLAEESGMTIADACELARQHKSKHFVIYDPKYRASAMVNSGQVLEIVDKYGWQPGESAYAAGLLSMLGREQLIVGENQPASRVAKLASETESPVVLAADSAGKPTGLFFPDMVAERLPSLTLPAKIYKGKLMTHVKGITGPGDLVRVLAEIEKVDPDFHNEGLNIVAADPYWCSAGHYVSSCPCNKHPSSTCKRAEVSS